MFAVPFQSSRRQFLAHMGAIGATDEIGLMAVERPHSVKDLHATILAALGMANDELAYEVSGRQERLTGVAGSAKVIQGVLS